MNTIRILVVDDNERSRRLLKDLLTARGYSVSEAVNGDEALALARSDTPDVMLLDVVLPRVGGFEVCRRLKGDPESASIFIIMLTCLTEHEHRAKGIECGADEFLTKPFEIDKLLRVIRAAVGVKGDDQKHE